jgi:DNA (cytosine-5)-methyltransferase 1
VDLFSGSGAVTAALKRSGFKVLAAVDNDPTACATYRLNHDDVTLYERDITKLRAGQIAVAGRVDLLVVCAPCQPFSSHNKKRANDPRASLVLESVRFIRMFSPLLVFFENVPGLGSSDIYETLQQKLKREGYSISNPRTFDAADFGVPQRRNRCVLMASRSKVAINSFHAFRPRKRLKTVFQAIGSLHPLTSGEADPRDELHRARTHQPIVLERLRHIPHDGGSRSALPRRLRLKCHANIKKKNSFPDVYGRMRWNDVAPTLTTGCTDVTKGRFAHPDQDRAITLREAAILQGFPRSYRFTGNPSSIATQIGNAVPLGLVEGLSPLFRKMITIARARRG